MKAWRGKRWQRGEEREKEKKREKGKMMEELGKCYEERREH